jgi:hypothetical protein
MTTETTAPDDALLRCPFCGAHPHHGLTKVEYDQLHGDPFQRGQVWCPKGHARIISTNLKMAKKEWNRRAGQAHAAGLLEAIAGPNAWLDSWAQHVGNCQGGYVCTCGLTRARSELSAAIAAAKGA